MPYIVTFHTAPTSDLRAAANALRGAIGDIKSLNDSLLGRHPLSAETVDLDGWLHTELRRFKTEAELEAFEGYLDALIGRCAAAGRRDLPTFDRKAAGGFFYKTHSGYAEIALECGSDGRWLVRGKAKFAKAPNIVAKKLRHDGLHVQVTRH